MPITLIIHVKNTDPVVGEVEEVPSPTDNVLVVHNPRLRDGKDISYLDDNVVTVVWPMDQINFIEIMAGEEQEEIIGFVRE